MPNSKLTSLRLQKGFSQQELAALIFVEQSTLSKYEKNQRTMPPEKLDRLAEVLNVKLADIAEGNQCNSYFENGSTVNGTDVVHAQHYYQVPKELLDTILSQQQALTEALKLMVERLPKNEK